MAPKKGKPKSGKSAKRGKQSPSNTPNSTPRKLIVDQPEASLDAQKLTYSDPSLLNPNITSSATLHDSNIEPSNLYEAEDGSSVADSETEENKLNVLSVESVTQNISRLSLSATGDRHVYFALNLSGYGLHDISILENYLYLQKVNLSYNNLVDLEALDVMTNLVELDVSHNKLTVLCGFQNIKKNLHKADFSYNKINTLPNMEKYLHLTSLDLSYNKLSQINGLHFCRSLKHLNLSHNQIDFIDDIQCLPLHYLNLSYNRIAAIEKVNKLTRLQHLDLSGNIIVSLKGLEQKPLLDTLDLEDNSITSLDEINFIKKLRSLRCLNLRNNPVQDEVDYRRILIFNMQKLTEIDKRPVTVEEKVSAVNLFNPSPEIQASLDHITHTVYQFLQPSCIYESTLPSIEMPYPMLVLCGPQACGKRELAHQLVANFSDYFGFGVSHTTRDKRLNETDGKDYHFVSTDDFQSLVRQGAFIQTYRCGNSLYGLTLDAIESVAKEGLACVTHMDLQGVRTLKNTYFEPRYVLICPKSSTDYTFRMFKRDVYTKEQIEKIISEQVREYAQVDQDCPGFFDMVISSDNLEDGYQRLRQLVMDYLGISELSKDCQVIQNDGTHVQSKVKSNTDRRSGGQVPRSWSRPSFHGLSSGGGDRHSIESRQFSKTESRRSSIEKASIKRREESVVEALQGTSSTTFKDLFQKPIFSIPLTAPALLEGSPLAQATSMYQDPAFGAGMMYESTQDQDTYEPEYKLKHSTKRFSANTPDDFSSQSSNDATSSGLQSAFNTSKIGRHQSLSSDLRLKIAHQEVLDQPLDLSGIKKGSNGSPDSDNMFIPENYLSSSLVGTNNKPILPPISSKLPSS